MLSFGKDMQPTIFQNENIKLSGYYSQIYLIESCRSVEYLEVYVTTLFTYLKWRVMTFIELPTQRGINLGTVYCVGDHLFDDTQ